MWASETAPLTFVNAPRFGFPAPGCAGTSAGLDPTKGDWVRGPEEQDDGKLQFCHLADVTPISAVPNCRPTTRRKPDYEPAGNTDEAQKKFGNVKAISSDMYFGRQDHADVSVQRVSYIRWAP